MEEDLKVLTLLIKHLSLIGMNDKQLTSLQRIHEMLSKPVAWREMDDGWVYYDSNSEPAIVNSIENHQKDDHGITLFPLYGSKLPVAKS